MEKDKHVGSETKRRASQALVAVLILAIWAAGTWATAGVAGDGAAFPFIPGTGQTGGKNSPPDNGDLPAARPHPRGLPRGRACPHEHRQDNREPGPLVTETVSRQALPGVGLISVIGACLRSLSIPGRPRPQSRTPPGPSGRMDRGQDTAATRRLPMDTGISGGFTLLLGGAGDRGRRR
jgi:hypothetical protein